MKNNIPCIGHLSSEDIIRASGFSYSDFDSKNILDIGCGFSGFLRHLRDKTHAQRLVGVDPVLKDNSSIAQGISQTKDHIHQLLNIQDISKFAQNQLYTHLLDIQMFSQASDGLEYYPDISGVGRQRFDYIFISFVYRHLSLMMKMQMDQQIMSLLSQGGIITVIDGMPELKEFKRRIGNSKLYVGNPEHFEKSVSALKVF